MKVELEEKLYPLTITLLNRYSVSRILMVDSTSHSYAENDGSLAGHNSEY